MENIYIFQLLEVINILNFQNHRLCYIGKLLVTNCLRSQIIYKLKTRITINPWTPRAAYWRQCLCHHWSKKWLGAKSAPFHFLNRC